MLLWGAAALTYMSVMQFAFSCDDKSCNTYNITDLWLHNIVSVAFAKRICLSSHPSIHSRVIPKWLKISKYALHRNIE